MVDISFEFLLDIGYLLKQYKIEHLILLSIGINFLIAFYFLSVIYYLKNLLSYLLFHILRLRVEGEVDYESKKNGGILVRDVLEAHNVRFVYTLVGGHVSPILVALEKSKQIQTINVRNEATAVFAADATARLTSTPGIALVTAGPGVTNTITALKNAFDSESPVLVIGGGIPLLLKGRGSLQDMDQPALLAPVCKKVYRVDKVANIVPILREALNYCISGVPGPVFVELPIDTLYSIKDISDEMSGKLKKKGKKLPFYVSWYLQYYVKRLFGGAFIKRDCSPLPLKILAPYKIQISRSKKTVILLGSQCVIFRNENCSPVRVREAIMAFNCPTFASGMTRGLLHGYSLLLRNNRKSALSKADLVLMFGIHCDFRLDYGRALSRKCEIVAVNNNIESLKLNDGFFWHSTLSINCDVPSLILELSNAMRQQHVAINLDDAWLKLLIEEDSSFEASRVEMSLKEKNENMIGVNPIKFLQHLNRKLDDNSILIGDGGDFVGSASYLLRPRKPLSWLDPGPYGTLGVGAGFAMAAKLVNPNAEVWLLYGDGSAGYSIIEQDTFKRHNIPSITVIGNDGKWNQIYRDQVLRFQSNAGCILNQSDYHLLTEPFGGKGYKITREVEIDRVLDDAKLDVKNGTSVVINVLITPTHFRDGSLAI